MPDLLHTTERDRLLATLRRMLREVWVDGQKLAGLARSEAHGAPLLTLDNAIAAEALAIPALRAADPALADAVLGFVMALGEEAGPPPRGALASAEGRVQILRSDPRDIRVLTPWHEFTGNLTDGVLRQRLRGSPRADDVLHTGNMVRMRLEGGVPGLLGRLSLRARTLDVEEAVTAQGVQPEGAGALMWHESTLQMSPVPGVRIDAGTIRYEYRVSAADPLLRLTVILRAGPKAGLSAVRLTTAVDALTDHARPFFGVSVGRAGSQFRRDPGPFADEEKLAEGPTDSFHLWQTGPEEEALALHIRPRAAEGVFSIRTQARAGAPHWVVLRHTVPNLARGGTATLREDRLLARGVAPGTPEAGLRLLRTPDALSGRDPGQAGLGAPLAAMASVLLNSPAFNHPIPRERLGRLREWVERQLVALPDEEAPPLPVAELASLVVALDAVWRAGGLPRDRRRLRQFLGQLVAAASPEGVIGTGLRDHGAAILALARAATLVPEPWVLETLQRAVLALRPEGPRLGGRAAEPDPDSPSLAAVLRGLRAMEVLAGSGGPSIDAAVLAQGRAVMATCLDVLSNRLRSHADRLEVMPRQGGQADARSHAALLLAVLSPDEVALSMGGVPA
ncbi:hypothetical protein [Roseomonas xinghualingensis]|uniref:hypothetical protein n=1 Tax=Roseomonas xinghualingensis TaxID=2986475 RepID=UPI0021F20E79|nr:hypothetical protein [Roseomonas sp. SXEYE001]MCV4206396.1 hypothetical protein [Roseomonas sp. SXEYE001]